MKKIAFIADLYFSEILGGGENNDANLINHLKEKYEVICHKTNEVSVADLEDVDGAIVGNFVLIIRNTSYMNTITNMLLPEILQSL